MATFNNTLVRGILGLNGNMVSTDNKYKVYTMADDKQQFGDTQLPTVINGSHVILSSAHYGTADPSTVFSAPKTGQIYFKIVS